MEVDPKKSTGFIIGRTAHLLRTRIAAAIKHAGFDLSAEESTILLIIGQAEQPQRMGDLAEILIRDATTLKRQLDGLFKRQLVYRQPDPADGRATLISLTPLGIRTLKKVTEVLEDLRSKVMHGVPKKDVEILYRSLNKMQENMLKDSPQGFES